MNRGWLCMAPGEPTWRWAAGRLPLPRRERAGVRVVGGSPGGTRRLGILPSPPTPLPQGARGISAYSPSPREESHQLSRSVVFEACAANSCSAYLCSAAAGGPPSSNRAASRESGRNSRRRGAGRPGTDAAGDHFAIEGGARMFETLMKTTLAPTPIACRRRDFKCGGFAVPGE